MLDPKKCHHALDDIAKKLTDALPDSLKHAKKDLQQTFHSILQSAFAKLDLVTREEFDVQVAVLAKTRSKLDVLERAVAELENQNGITKPDPEQREND
ncbi:MAG: accessory factor UbiK family protein [Gammaproteobacteria bacterium]